MTHKRRSWFCGSPEHDISRRAFLGAAGLGAAAAADMSLLDVLQSPVLAQELKQQRKSVILLWLAGGASQFETWDPKPGRPTGGPFRAIETNVPGMHICELLPKMAQQMQNTCLIRSLNTRIADHGGGSHLMQMGRMDEPNLKYPDLGAVVAKELGRADSKVPDYVTFYSQTEGRGNAVGRVGFLGGRYSPMFLTTGMMPDNIVRLEGVTELDHQARADLRDLLARRFTAGRENNSLGSHTSAYSRVQGLMSSADLFDLEKEPQQARDQYGPTLFGQQALVARRLVQAGVPFVKVGRAWWDSHGQNFETHRELVADLDHVMSTLLTDLEARGMLENTLVITLGEFGRTPKINASLGRDHFARAWSCSLSGCGIQGGAVYGETDEDGNTVKDGEVGAAELFATIFQALGINHHKDYYVGSRPIPLTDPGTEPIKAVLS